MKFDSTLWSILIVLFSHIFMNCSTRSQNSYLNTDEGTKASTPGSCIANPEATGIDERFDPPSGYLRTEVDLGSFAEYLRTLPLQKHGSLVHLFNGTEKSNLVHEAVLDVSVGNRDLQQCADAIIRLRAEYLYKRKRFADIHFNLTNGFCVDFISWIQGKRVNVSGNKTTWYATGKISDNYDTFLDYLFFVYIYAGSLSLSKELKAIDPGDMQIGDVFIQGGTPGHAVIVVDMAINQQTGDKVFILAQSYMPAQEIHILKNNDNAPISPWYKLEPHTVNLKTPEWTFQWNDLRRF